jgi:hypothetical protein
MGGREKRRNGGMEYGDGKGSETGVIGNMFPGMMGKGWAGE